MHIISSLVFIIVLNNINWKYFFCTRHHIHFLSQKNIYIHPMLVSCWDSVCDAGPTWNQHWLLGLCTPRKKKLTKRGNIGPIADPTSRDSGGMIYPHRFNAGSMLVHPPRRWRNIEPTMGQYLVFSRYCCMEWLTTISLLVIPMINQTNQTSKPGATFTVMIVISKIDSVLSSLLIALQTTHVHLNDMFIVWGARSAGPYAKLTSIHWSQP